MADVFVSYAREDRARAEQVASGLAAAGLEVFWDNEIPPGQTWADYIESKLAQCKVLIVLWSETSTKSQWVREEARLGRDKGVLIPAMIDASQAPFGFGEVQAANLADWRGEADNPNWRRFVEAVRAAAAREAPIRPAPMTPPRDATPRGAAAPPPTSEKKPLPVWVWLAGAAIVGAIAIAALLSMTSQTPPQTAAIPGAATPAQPGAPTGESPQAIILAQLQQAQAALAQQGFQMVGQPYSGGLAQGETWNVPTQLMMGYDYRLLGVCDRDCADLDLVLYDGAGAPVVQDRTTTSQPIMAIQPGYSGQYLVQVQMYNCTVAPCYYAVALYARPLQ